MEAANKIAIITDTCCDLPQEYLKEYPIFCVPLVVTSGTESYRDNIDITVETIYARQKNENFKTSLPRPQDIEDVYSAIARQGYTHVIVLMIAECLSSANNLMRLAAEEHPELTVKVFDSKSASIGLGALAVQVARYAVRGVAFDPLCELTKRVREIKSVTIGVNLDAQLRPKDAGVLSINPEQFRSGDVIEKILRLNFKDDEYTCIAKLVPFNKNQTDNQKTALSIAFNSAINDVYSSSLRSWKKIVQQYVLENTDFLLNLIPEIEFLVKGTRMLKRLKEKHCPLCFPELAPAAAKTYRAYGLYNPAVALKIEGEVVPNDLVFDENATIYVLSGPNRGGKSVITCALGISQAMLQLGMFVPAQSAVMSPVDGIYTHFPTGADDTIDKGRLGEECARLDAIISSVTDESLVLLDESLSSTGSFEASYIAAEVLGGFALIGCRVLFSTHLHELAAMIDDINSRTAKNGGVRIDTLVAGIEEGKRSFKITRAKPDGKSYARDIAEKYGLSYDSIKKKVEMKK